MSKPRCATTACALAASANPILALQIRNLVRIVSDIPSTTGHRVHHETPGLPLLTMLRRAGFVILAVVFVVASCLAIAGRGPWYDEFYAFYLVRPGAPPGVLIPAWLRDNHPPLFYLLAWLWARLLGLVGLAASVEAVRTVNLAVLAATLAVFGWIARSDPWFRGLAWTYALALAALFPALDRIDQLRSYFLSLALTALVLPLLLRQLHRDAPARPVLLWAMLALACSVHLVTTVIVAGVMAAVLVCLALARRWHAAVRLALLGAAALVPFAVFLAVQLPTIMGNTRTFWIPPGFNGARWAIESELLDAITGNPALGLAALAGSALLLIRARRGDASSRAALRDITCLAGGLALALAVLVAAHIHRPLLITRYLVAVDGIVALMLALAAQSLTRRLPARATIAIDAALLLGTCLAIHANLGATLRQWSWNGTASTIAGVVQRCPTTLVYPDLHWNAEPLGMPPRENLEVVPFSYRYMAQRYGFALAPAGSHTLSSTCPTLFWADHAARFHPAANDVIRALRAAGYPVSAGRMVRHDIGWVLVTPPANPAPPPATVRHGRSG